MKNIREEIIEGLKDGFAHQYDFDITIDEFNELEENRVEFAHEVGRTIGNSKMDMLEGNDESYKILRITRVIG